MLRFTNGQFLASYWCNRP